ncbi:MAG: serine/threonine-protein kinase, partial [Chloroflexota bacterium]
MNLVDIQELVGQSIKGYELIDKIGAGGFGAVYRARQPLVKREVAVKVILPDFTNNAEFVRRFEAEAQLVANLEHPHIVPLYDYWRDATGAYLVMRWLRGGSLKTMLEDGHWPLQDIPRVLDQVAGALAVAHRNGVIHRDLKPENILLDEDRNAYLADFGIAKDLNRISDAATFIERAEDERMVGSPEFMSPEQIQLGDITPQTDIYSLGVVLYMMLTGRKPFEGPNISTVISKHLFEQIPHIHDVRPDLPSNLQRVVERATEKQPSERYPDVLSMALDFHDALGTTTTAEIHELESLESLDVTSGAESNDALWAALEAETAEWTQTALGVEPSNPYKGLRPFGEADADDFFGREGQVEALLARLGEEGVRARLIALVGASGSGKSSLVRAGLLPAIRRGDVEGANRWFITDMTPGTHPLEELEAALLRIAVNPPNSLMDQLREDARGLARAVKRVLPGGDDADTELLLFIDQFEELFTQGERESER